MSRATAGSEGSLELIARARAAGKLREDFTSQDLPVLLMANAGVVTSTGDAAPDAHSSAICCAATPPPGPTSRRRVPRVDPT